MMQPGPYDYKRDWDLLACVCAEWTKIRGLFRLGRKATRQQIEAVWEKIFNTDPKAWPCIRRLFDEMMRDADLYRFLRRCYWRHLRLWERRDYLFEEVVYFTIYRLWWVVVRNSCTWLAKRKPTDQHWARFWNIDNLTEELRRAIEDMWENEGPRDARLPNDL